MLNQYRAQRRLGGNNPHGIGTVPVGTIAYVQFNGRNPWIIEAWMNREYFPCVKGAPEVTYMLGGHLALCRSLRNGERRLFADWHFLDAY